MVFMVFGMIALVIWWAVLWYEARYAQIEPVWFSTQSVNNDGLMSWKQTGKRLLFSKHALAQYPANNYPSPDDELYIVANDTFFRYNLRFDNPNGMDFTVIDSLPVEDICLGWSVTYVWLWNTTNDDAPIAYSDDNGQTYHPSIDDVGEQKRVTLDGEEKTIFCGITHITFNRSLQPEPTEDQSVSHILFDAYKVADTGCAWIENKAIFTSPTYPTPLITNKILDPGCD